MIEVRGLTARYGSSVVLSDLSLSVEDGEWLLLVGENGAGKTTLLHHFNGLREPEDGTVLIDGTPVGEDLVGARTAVGLVFQNPRDGFVASTVGADVAFGPENLGLDREVIERRVDDALEAVGMAGRRDDRIDELSGGEHARVAVAGALAMDPDHLVLDEPLAGLDGGARRSVLDRLETLHAAGTGIVVATHDLRDLAALADRVVGLADGLIALEGPPDTVGDRLPDIGVRPPC